MTNHAEEAPNAWLKFLSAAAGVVALAVCVLGGTQTPVRARTATSQAPPTQSAPAPQWQVDAGGKMEFDVASVKQNKTEPSPTNPANSNVAMGPGDYYAPTGGFFTATNLPLFTYITFAYKASGNQVRQLASQVPKWVLSDHFDIQGRMEGSPTKDQMRLMMQALLLDRFKLTAHHETRQLPIFALVQVKPGKTGPQLLVHPSTSPCSTLYQASPSQSPAAQGAASASDTVAAGFPAVCGGIQAMQPINPGRARMGARNVSMEVIASSFSAFGNLDRPSLDRTGLAGNFDFALEWTPVLNSPPPPGSTFQPDADGPTFLEALQDQLGLKLESQQGPVDVIVIDHVEEPSPN